MPILIFFHLDDRFPVVSRSILSKQNTHAGKLKSTLNEIFIIK